MQNVTQRIEGTKLILEIDMTQDHGLSGTGKTHTVAKSGFANVAQTPDNPAIPEGLGFTLNVWKKKPKA